MTLEDSRIHDNGLTGWASAVDRCRQGNVVCRNRIWANTDLDSRESEGHGVIMDYCENNGSAIIESNVIWQNEGWCITTYNSNNGVIRNNTCWLNGKDRSTTGEISIRDGTNHNVHNNILNPRPGRLAINVKSGSQALAEFNLANGDWTLGWPDYLNFINADPMLINPGAGDFHLGAGSPAIDSGDNANAASTGADGNIRPQDGSGLGYARVDLGAYEYVQNSMSVDGDINGDGLVNTADVLLAQRTLHGDFTLTGSPFLRADVAPRVAGNPVPDGQFNAGDLLVILRLALETN